MTNIDLAQLRLIYEEYKDNREIAMTYGRFVPSALADSEFRRGQIVDMARESGIKNFAGTIKELVTRMGLEI